MRHSRWLIELGRVLAIAGALGLGSAIAWADEDNNRDQGRAAQEQKDDKDDDSSRNNDRDSRRDDRDDDSDRRDARSNRDDDRDFREGGQQGIPTRGNRQSQSTNRQGRGFDDEQWSQDQRGGRQQEVGAKFYLDDDDQLTVSNVDRSSLAARAGLKEDDVIVSVDGRRFRNEDDLHHYLNSAGARRVPIVIERDGERYTVTLNQQLQQNNRQGFANEQWSQDQRQGNRQREVGAKFYTDDDDQITVASIERSGIASRAGLHEDDVIVSVDGRRFRNEDDLHHYLNNAGSRQVPVIIERDGHRYTVTLNQQQQNWSNQQRGLANPQTDRSADTAWLGVYLDDNENGPVITQVYPQGPAARAGLRQGDVVVQIDGEDLTDSEELVEKIEEKDPNSRARFTILRDDREFQVSATLVSRNQFAASRGQGQQQNQNQQNRGFYDREEYTEFNQNRTQRGSQQNDQWSRGQDQDRGYQTFSSRGQGSQQGYRTADRTAELERQIEQLRQEVRELRQSVERR